MGVWAIRRIRSVWQIGNYYSVIARYTTQLLGHLGFEPNLYNLQRIFNAFYEY